MRTELLQLSIATPNGEDGVAATIATRGDADRVAATLMAPFADSVGQLLHLPKCVFIKEKVLCRLRFVSKLEIFRNTV
ncbi:unnamed protein product [Strongylus vulgaris]|uniref:Uncharacterized protein n=1 Tax=Strongylus vulgaris TaxID=40348 RepID=A0A3P7JQK6_STRVU|nr:unnamed protein product [Strongylus vulgaris]